MRLHLHAASIAVPVLLAACGPDFTPVEDACKRWVDEHNSLECVAPADSLNPATTCDLESEEKKPAELKKCERELGCDPAPILERYVDFYQCSADTAFCDGESPLIANSCSESLSAP